jgi:hypothetical protein
MVLGDRDSTAELGVSVVDSDQRRGIGTVVLQSLIEIARQVHLYCVVCLLMTPLALLLKRNDPKAVQVRAE